MLCCEKRPPFPNVTSSNTRGGVAARGARTKSRTAYSTSLLTAAFQLGDQPRRLSFTRCERVGHRPGLDSIFWKV